MELFLVALLLLALIAISNIMNRVVFFIPVPLVQIALGMAVAIIPSGLRLPLSPELFFVLFVAPLLFNDGKRVPRSELWKLRAPILLLALGLVFATVVVVGHVVHWMIPSIPTPAAYALAAILSPTDAVAVSALSGRIRLPKEIMRLLEGEALMNDASGLVAFKFAIAAAVTGMFSLPAASLSFVTIAAGGLLCGASLALLLIGFRVLLRRYGMEDMTLHTLIQILTPFLIYLAAEELGVSGILAVVAGGILHAVERDRTEALNMRLQFVSASTWSVVLFVLNGLVFVILGVQIPAVLGTILEDETFNNVRVIGYIFAIGLTLIGLRFAWVYLFQAIGSRGSRKGRRVMPAALTALSGVRGAVTLAGAFSIPLYLEDGSPFPERSLIIFLAAGIILFSLIAASVVLPLLAGSGSTGEEKERQSRGRERKAKIRMLEKAVEAVKEAANEENKAAAASVISDYRRQLLQIRADGKDIRKSAELRKETKRLHLHALAAERRRADELIGERRAAPASVRRIRYLLKQTELRLTNRLLYAAGQAAFAGRRLVGTRFGRAAAVSRREQREELRLIRRETAEAAIRALRSSEGERPGPAALSVISHYREMVERLNSGLPMRRGEADGDKRIREIQALAIRTEREEIRKLYEQGEINRSTVARLRSFINVREASFEGEE